MWVPELYQDFHQGCPFLFFRDAWLALLGFRVCSLPLFTSLTLLAV